MAGAIDGQQTMGEYNVDIVMCIDATGSMSPIIEEVKANAISFYEQFVNCMEEADKDVAQLRIKVIAFRDYGCDSEPMIQSEFFVLPDQNEDFRSFVDSIKATGGGDGPENEQYHGDSERRAREVHGRTLKPSVPYDSACVLLFGLLRSLL